MHILITYNRKISVNNHFLGDHLLSTYVKFSEKNKYFLPFDTTRTITVVPTEHSE